ALRKLKVHGYTINWSGSWWGPTRTNKQADVVYDEIFKADVLGDKFTVGNWQELFLGQHVLGRFLAADLPVISQVFHYDQPNQRDIINHQLDSVKESVDSKAGGPQFSFFHLLTPHPLYVFDQDGSTPDYHQSPDVDDVPEKEKYVNQLVYINKRILETIDYILENSPEPPVIVFQPDEGPYLFDTGEKLSAGERAQWKHGVTSAFYLPGYEQDEIELSPVNIFRYLFNEYVGYELDYLENRNYNYSKSSPYNFQNITELIEEE
ncbi:MAG TPA: sulfatase-like hydrolase/transferase, partial [Candidatus Saccharimonadales bacterium]